jgi:hypothetical protein
VRELQWNGVTGRSYDLYRKSDGEIVNDGMATESWDEYPTPDQIAAQIEAAAQSDTGDEEDADVSDTTAPTVSTRTVDTMPAPNLDGTRWTWSLDEGEYRGACVVEPLAVQVRVSNRGAVGGRDYTLAIVASFSGYVLYRDTLRLPVTLPQLTPDAVLHAVEEHDMLREAVEHARSLVDRMAQLLAEVEAGR